MGSGSILASVGYGTGLQGIADRLGALEGALRIDSEVGRGTTVSGQLPIATTTDPLEPDRDQAMV